MKLNIVREWVERLESGEYEQGKGVLRDKDNKYCCLGVLCEVAKDHGVGDWIRNYAHGHTFRTEESEGTSWVPRGVSAWLMDKAEDVDPIYEIESYAIGYSVGNGELASMNDYMEMTFEEIAQQIRKRYLNEEVVSI